MICNTPQCILLVYQSRIGLQIFLICRYVHTLMIYHQSRFQRKWNIICVKVQVLQIQTIIWQTRKLKVIFSLVQNWSSFKINFCINPSNWSYVVILLLIKGKFCQYFKTNNFDGICGNITLKHLLYFTYDNPMHSLPTCLSSILLFQLTVVPISNHMWSDPTTRPIDRHYNLRVFPVELRIHYTKVVVHF